MNFSTAEHARRRRDVLAALGRAAADGPATASRVLVRLIGTGVSMASARRYLDELTESGEVVVFAETPRTPRRWSLK